MPKYHLEDVAVPTPPAKIKIGKYLLITHRSGFLWLEKEDGEGMQCKEELLEKLLDGFWEEEY